KVLVLNCAAYRGVDGGVVVDEMGEFEQDAVRSLLFAGSAEAHIGNSNAGAPIEVARVEPPLGTSFDSGATLRNEPYLCGKDDDEPRDRFEAAGHRGGREHGCFVSLEECGVAAVRMARPVDDHAPDVNAESWSSFVHDGIVDLRMS